MRIGRASKAGRKGPGDGFGPSSINCVVARCSLPNSRTVEGRSRTTRRARRAVPTRGGAKDKPLLLAANTILDLHGLSIVLATSVVFAAKAQCDQRFRGNFVFWFLAWPDEALLHQQATAAHSRRRLSRQDVLLIGWPDRCAGRAGQGPSATGRYGLSRGSLTGRGGTASGFHPAMVRAHSRCQ